MALKVKIKATNKDAERVSQALQNLPPKDVVRQNRIPNYVSDDSLHIPAGANSSKQKGSERLPDSTQDPRAGQVNQNRTEAEYKSHAFPEPSVNPVDDELASVRLKPTTVGGAYAKLPANHPEHDRQANNRVRDARTNLGRAKTSLPVVE